MTTSYNTVFEKLDKRLTAVEKRVQGKLPPQSRVAFRNGADTPAAEIALLTAQLTRLQEERNRLTKALDEKELALECNGLQLRRAADDRSRLEREVAALTETVAEEQRRSVTFLQENDRVKNEMRFLKAELDYRLGEKDELQVRCQDVSDGLAAKDAEIARLFGRVKELEEEREELNGRLAVASLRHRTLYAGGHHHSRRRRSLLRRLIGWLSRPMFTIGNAHD